MSALRADRQPNALSDEESAVTTPRGARRSAAPGGDGSARDADRRHPAGCGWRRTTVGETGAPRVASRPAFVRGDHPAHSAWSNSASESACGSPSVVCSLRLGSEADGAGEGIRTLDPNLGKVVLYP